MENAARDTVSPGETLAGVIQERDVAQPAFGLRTPLEAKRGKEWVEFVLMRLEGSSIMPIRFLASSTTDTEGSFRPRRVAIGPSTAQCQSTTSSLLPRQNRRSQTGDIFSSVRMLSKGGVHLVLGRLEGSLGRRNQHRPRYAAAGSAASLADGASALRVAISSGAVRFQLAL